jgi:hypothetical protein
MAGWMIKLGGTHVVPLINLMNEQLLTAPLIHCDETRLQVLKSDKAPSADHWIWVRASGPLGRRIVLFDYDPSRGGAVPMRLFEGFKGILLTDGYEPYNAPWLAPTSSCTQDVGQTRAAILMKPARLTWMPWAARVPVWSSTSLVNSTAWSGRRRSRPRRSGLPCARSTPPRS